MKKQVKSLRDENSLEFRRYRTHVDQIVNECSILSRAFGWSVEQWADKAGISHSAVYNLLNRTTRYPRFYTLYQLAKAVGAEIWVEQLKAKEMKARYSKIQKRKEVKA